MVAASMYATRTPRRTEPARRQPRNRASVGSRRPKGGSDLSCCRRMWTANPRVSGGEGEPGELRVGLGPKILKQGFCPWCCIADK
jgi:hypothetical protein